MCNCAVNWCDKLCFFRIYVCNSQCQYESKTYAVFICTAVRLAGSGLLYEGRLEVYHNNRWGTVCSSSFDSTDATVACRSIFGSGLIYYLYSLSLKLYLFSGMND